MKKHTGINGINQQHHAFGSIDHEDRKQAYAEARGTWITVGFALALGVLAGLVYVGRL